MTKIAINGFGRIGRSVLKIILDKHPKLDVVAINDLSDAKTLAHLLKFDSIYGMYKKAVKAADNELLIDGTKNGKRIEVFTEKDSSKLPWKELGVDVVIESTGNFTDYESAKKHITAGAKKVIISAPSKDADKVSSFVIGVNEEKFDPKINDVVDMGSCTTNCLAPVVKILQEQFGIVKGFMSTIHAYTNDQRILDVAHKDLRRARAAALNIIPTTTGAAKAIGKVIPELKGKLDGLAFRVPVPTVSIVDLVCVLGKETTSEEVNYVLKKASQRKELKGILGVEDALLVSSDYIGNSYSSIVDSDSTMANGNLVKILSWYDNEFAYACRMAEFAEYIGQKI